MQHANQHHDKKRTKKLYISQLRMGIGGGGGVEGARAGGGTTATHALQTAGMQNSVLRMNAKFRELLNRFP